MELQDRIGHTPEWLAQQADEFMAAARKRPDIGRISTLYGVIVSLCTIGVATNRTRVRRVTFALAAAAMTLSGGALSGLCPGNVDAGPMLAAALSAYATWVVLGGVVRSHG